MSDQFVFQVSNEAQATAEPMIQKSVVYQTDMNNLSYSSGQIMLDTSSLSNSGKWASYSEGTLVVPLVMALTPTSTITGWDTNNAVFAAGLKNSWTTLIHSLSVEYNNSTVIQLTPFSNIYLHYKMLTSMSLDDQEKLGAVTNFYKDTSDSWSYSATATADGKGESNNRNMGWEMLFPSITQGANTNGLLFTANTIAQGGFPAQVGAGVAPGDLTDCVFNISARPWQGWDGTCRTTANYGFYRRQKPLSCDFHDSSETAVYKTDRYSTFLSSGNATSMAFSQFTAGAKSKVWYFLATIRLKDISDFFNQLPLVRGAYMRFIINMNMGNVTLLATKVAGDAVTPEHVKWEQTAASLTQQTFPCMFASAYPGQGSYPLGTADNLTTKSVKLAIGIYSLTPSTYGGDDTDQYSFYGPARLYVPVYTLNPIAEAAYLEANPTKTIIYRDILNYTITEIKANDSVNRLLTNGVVNPKQVLVFPFLAASANDGTFSPYQSAFSTAPCTTSPFPVFNQVNLLVAGINVFAINQIYNWQHFVDEIQHENAINGGQSTGLQSGLLDYWSWTNNFRVLSINVSRRIGSENSIPKSVQLSMVSACKKTLDLICFIELERSLTISLLNGQLVA